MATLWIIISIVITGVSCQEQSNAPKFTHYMEELVLSEDRRFGLLDDAGLVYRLGGTDADTPVEELVWGLESENQYFQLVSPNNVYLMKPLDYETDREIRVNISLSDGTTTSKRSAIVRVTDVNDEEPTFVGAFSATIPENDPAGTSVYPIAVEDQDTINNPLTVECVRGQNEGSEVDPCNIFLVEGVGTNQRYNGWLILSTSLDYERQSSYQIYLTTFDGKFSKTQLVDIQVTDRQDTAPVFISALSTTINENVRFGEKVISVTAIDGDRGDPRPITYSLVINPYDLFTIQTIQGVGVIRANTFLSRDNTYLANGYIELEVQASEMGGGQDSSTRATLTIRFNDVNDNPPVFEKTEIYVDMVENAAGTQLAGSQLVVSDKDSGINAEFEVFIRDPSMRDIFEIYPNRGNGSLTAFIEVKDNAVTDYDQGLTGYTLNVIAKETRTEARLESGAIVYINLQDDNDNWPYFHQNTYEATIDESDFAGPTIMTVTANDLDLSEPFGASSIRYRLFGLDSVWFTVNLKTGAISLKPCATPGSGNCIDYEAKKVYRFKLMAKDSFGEGRYNTTDIIVNVNNVNDNPPIFERRNYTSFIDEGQREPDPPIIVQAYDDDVDARIEYSIVSGNTAGVWQIGRDNGVITSTRDVDYESTPDGYFRLTVRAYDGLYPATADVYIYVNDGNDHPPVFLSNYQATINEETTPGTPVVRVSASDNDPSSTNNGQVRYRITGGSLSQFVIDDISGQITTAPGSSFDYSLKDRYDMTVIAEDQGKPQRSATTKVVVNIRDSNNMKPYFLTSIHRENVPENDPIGYSVYQMRAYDIDDFPSLSYQFVEPTTAWDKFGAQVSSNTGYKNMFRIDPVTGDVKVNSDLNRDVVGQISFTVQVRDDNGGPDQTATATLIITITDINDRYPVFSNGWTENDPYIDLTVLEELETGYYVTTIVATDPDNDGISRYFITTNPGVLFQINDQTGVVTVARRLDYETVQQVDFVVVATDRGSPSLSSTATVRVQVVNINDETPQFVQPSYTSDISEAAVTGQTVTKVSATDRDLGDYGVVKYSIDDASGALAIDPDTGWVTIKNPAPLDRETTKTISSIVRAYDSPGNPNVRRFSSVPFYLTLMDYNDNRPIFDQPSYEGTVVETVPPQTSVVTITAADADEGNNGKVYYFIVGGNDKGLFTIDKATGEITTSGDVRGQSGQYNLTVEARDEGEPGLTNQARVIINIVDANNGPPVWKVPRYSNETVSTPEFGYPGMIVTYVKAEDKDEGVNGEVRYGFIYDGEDTLKTPDFEINSATGIISAERTFDRETQSFYIVQLYAEDHGEPSYRSTIFLNITIQDVDDHDPEFPQYQNCCVIPYRFEVTENQAAGEFVGKVNAIDLDIGPNADSRYYIIDGNIDKHYEVDPFTGEITTTRPLDHETQSSYLLFIRAENFESSSSLSTIPETCICNDPSLALVYIDVVNENDFPPTFLNRVYNACVSIDAKFNKLVTTVRAVDYDDLENAKTSYQITDIQSMAAVAGVNIVEEKKDMFGIWATNGSIFTKSLMTQYKDHYFEVDVKAIDLTDSINDLSGACVVRIWVTQPAQELTITVKRPIEQVQGDLPEIIDWIQEEVPNAIICVNDIRFHVNDNIEVVSTWTDILLHIVNGNTYEVYEPEVIIGAIWPPDGDSKPQVDAILVGAVEPTYTVFGGFKIDLVLAVVIVLLLILFLVLLLLCCLYWCWGACCGAKEKTKKALYLDANPLVMPSGTINPLWKQHDYEDQEINMDVAGIANAGYDDSDLVPNGMALQLAAPGGVTETRTETTNEYQMSYERTQTTQEIIGGGSSGGPTPRIEAELEPRPDSSDSGIRSTSGIQMSMRGGGTMLHTSSAHTPGPGSYPMPPAIPIQSLQNPHRKGISGIGATLYSSQTDLSQFSGYSEQPSPQNYMDGFNTTWPRGYPAGQAIHDDFPQGMYQGEILLGTFRPPPGHMQEARYLESSQYYDGGMHPSGYEMDMSYH